LHTLYAAFISGYAKNVLLLCRHTQAIFSILYESDLVTLTTVHKVAKATFKPGYKIILRWMRNI
jgi:hypothetical protein